MLVHELLKTANGQGTLDEFLKGTDPFVHDIELPQRINLTTENRIRLEIEFSQRMLTDQDSWVITPILMQTNELDVETNWIDVPNSNYQIIDNPNRADTSTVDHQMIIMELDAESSLQSFFRYRLDHNAPFETDSTE